MTSINSLLYKSLKNDAPKKLLSDNFVSYWRSFVEKRYFSEQSEIMSVTESNQDSTGNLMTAEKNISLKMLPIIVAEQQQIPINISTSSRVSPSTSNIVEQDLPKLLNNPVAKTNVEMDSNKFIFQTNSIEKLNLVSYLNKLPNSQQRTVSSLLNGSGEQAANELIQVIRTDDQVQLIIRDASLSSDKFLEQVPQLKKLIKHHLGHSLTSITVNGKEAWTASDKRAALVMPTLYQSNETSLFDFGTHTLDKSF